MTYRGCDKGPPVTPATSRNQTWDGCWLNRPLACTMMEERWFAVLVVGLGRPDGGDGRGCPVLALRCVRDLLGMDQADCDVNSDLMRHDGRSLRDLVGCGEVRQPQLAASNVTCWHFPGMTGPD